MSIRVSQLTKTYGTQTAVHQLSFTVNKGEIVGFLGPNGAGKSTTIKMLTGYLAPDNGSAWINDIPVSTSGLAHRAKLGYLAENNALYTDLYVKEYLSFVAKAHQVHDAGKRLSTVMELTGLLPEQHKKIAQLSKGYKQRVGLAAALIHDPEVLILDEPTSGLDPNQLVEIRHLIQQLGANKTVLFSSHILQEVEALCDRVIIINKGNCVYDGAIAQLSTQQEPVVFLQLGEALEAAWLERLPAVQSVNRITAFEWELKGDAIEAIKREVMALALAENLHIVQLTHKRNDLEESFRQLTNPS